MRWDDDGGRPRGFASDVAERSPLRRISKALAKTFRLAVAEIMWPRQKVPTQPNPPMQPDHGVTFDFEAIAHELRAREPYLREGHTARTLVRTSDLRVVLVALAAGETISEHHANVTASVQTLSGQIRLQLPDRAVDVHAGQLLVLGAGLSHDVYAESDSTLLLTLGWPVDLDEVVAPK